LFGFILLEKIDQIISTLGYDHFDFALSERDWGVGVQGYISWFQGPIHVDRMVTCLD